MAEVAHTPNHHRARHGKFATVAARDGAQAVAVGGRCRGVSGAGGGGCA